METLSTKPYLLRALYEWCTDSGLTPYIVVAVNAETRVPHEFIRDSQITLNISANATQHLRMENDWISFAARFGGVARDISVPVARVLAIYAKENGAGMAFELDEPEAAELDEQPEQAAYDSSGSDSAASEDAPVPTKARKASRPAVEARKTSERSRPRAVAPAIASVPTPKKSKAEAPDDKPPSAAKKKKPGKSHLQRVK